MSQYAIEVQCKAKDRIANGKEMIVLDCIDGKYRVGFVNENGIWGESIQTVDLPYALRVLAHAIEEDINRSR